MASPDAEIPASQRQAGSQARGGGGFAAKGVGRLVIWEVTIPPMLSVLLPAVAAGCLVHPIALDAQIGKRALPWLPPDLARQIVRHERDFARGAASAVRWPESLHRPGGEEGVETAVVAQCERLVSAIRRRTPFSEVVAGLGALAHLVLDAHWPFPNGRTPDGAAFGNYVMAASPRIPMVFYGQNMVMIRGPSTGLRRLLLGRTAQQHRLAGLAAEDLARFGGPSQWRRLDDRSTSFAIASLTINHATTDFVNLASWVWYHGGGLVPEMQQAPDALLVWRGEPQPREAPRPHLGFR